MLLGVPKRRIKHWFTGRNLRDGLKLRAFLKKQRTAKARAEPNVVTTPAPSVPLPGRFSWRCLRII
jgi:hypothetical protein